MAAYAVTRRFYEIDLPSRLAETRRLLASRVGLVVKMPADEC